MTEESAWRRATILALVGLGVALRLREYLANRSLWLDEAYLALNVMDRSYAGLVGTLSDGQAAPVGFLFAQRLIITTFGSSEYALRALPLLASIVAVIAFAALAGRVLPPAGKFVGIAIFALSELLIYYAAETKQYGVDAAVAVIIWLSFTALRPRLERNEWQAWAMVAVLGAIAICFSHPAVFVLGGLGIYALVRAVLLRSRRAVVLAGATAMVWFVTFLALYFVSLRFVSPGLYQVWRGAEVPLMPTTSRQFTQYVNLVWTVGLLPLGRQVLPLVALGAVIGMIALWRRSQPHYLWFAGTLALVCLASSLGKYPLAIRLWLFLTPAVVLIVGAGVEEMWRRTRPTFPEFAPLFVVLLLAYPLGAAAERAIRPPGKEEVRPLLQHIQRHYRDGDVLYVYPAAQYATRYYAAQGLGFAGPVKLLPVERESRNQLEEDVARMRGQPRVWILFAHARQRDGLGDERLFINALDAAAMRLDSVRAPGATLYLYDLSRQPSTTR